MVMLACTPSPPPPDIPAPAAAPQPPPPAAASSATPSLDPPAEPPPDPRPPPLDHPDPFAFLPVSGFGDAVVSLPLGTRDPRPIVLATHGNYDTPEWQCQVWRDIVANDAFVLCPRGAARGDSPSPSDIRYQYVSNQHLEKEIDAGVEALRAAYPAYVDDGPLLFTGFSQGAIMGASIMARRPGRYPRAVLIEGGQRAWYAASAKAFSEGGGQRILFACGQWDCNRQALDAGRVLEKQGVASRAVFRKGEGHSYGGGVAEEIAIAFDWVIEGDERWAHRR
jgi:predicted esterase